MTGPTRLDDDDDDLAIDRAIAASEADRRRGRLQTAAEHATEHPTQEEQYAADAHAAGPRTAYRERVAQAERLVADRKAGDLLASEVLAEALARQHRDPLTRLRAKLAGRVVNTAAGYAALDDDQDPAEVAALGAAVALELVERDRPTAEAKIARVVGVCGRLMAQSRAGTEAATQVLDVLREQPAPSEDQLTPRDVLASTLVAHGAPRPVELAEVLLAALDRHGLTVVPR